MLGVDGRVKWSRITLITQKEVVMKLQQNENWQTRSRGDNDSEYQIYLACADNGNGIDVTTGKPLKTYDEWCNS
jgi:hypothetical protein